MRTFIRSAWLAIFLSEFRWYRKVHGEKWMRSHIDFPVCSACWMDVPDTADRFYREPLWRGTPTIEVWPA